VGLHPGHSTVQYRYLQDIKYVAHGKSIRQQETG
jgi:hypothetical protein